jgi:FixJ family two-component response regulator
VDLLPTVVHIVDDDAPFRTAVGRLLRASGYEVAFYESAGKILERLPAGAGPSCILLDVQMPGITGPELRSRLARLGSTVPIVFLTGHGESSTYAEEIEAGATEFLAKPVSKERLLGAIERAVAHCR